MDNPITAVLLTALDRFLEAAVAVARNRALVSIERRLEIAMQRGFRKQGRLFLTRFERCKSMFPSESLREAEESRWEVELTIAMAATAGEMAAALNVAASAAILAGGAEAYASLAIEGSFSLANPAAVRYLENYGARLVAGIDETTRGYLRGVITEGVDKGWSYNRMARVIIERYREFAVGMPQKHIQSRAHMIAVTEAGNAYEEAKMIVGRDLVAAGLEMEKEWVVTGGDICELCLSNTAQGWIPLEQAWSGGVMAPLQHPACRCTQVMRRKRAGE